MGSESIVSKNYLQTSDIQPVIFIDKIVIAEAIKFYIRNLLSQAHLLRIRNAL